MDFVRASEKVWSVQIDRDWVLVPPGVVTVNVVAPTAAVFFDVDFTLIRPRDYDVLATLNLNGDYLSDALAAQVGEEIVIAARRDQDGGVRFSVRDHGPGIPLEYQPRMFEKFFRVPGSPEGGSGLGLFIAKGLVQAHGGKIGVSSTAGQGATFWFTVPVAARSTASTRRAAPGPPCAARARTRHRSRCHG